MTDAARRGWAAQIQHEIKELTGVPDLIGRDGTRLSVRLTTLLTRQHAATVRLVKKLIKDVEKIKKIVGKDDPHAQGMMDGLECVLAALATRKGGGG